MANDGGIGRLKKRLAAIPKNVKEAVQPALQKQADEMATTMRQFAEPSRATGALIDSIEVTPAGRPTPPYSQPGASMVVPENAVAITVGNTDVRYGHLVEHGTAPHDVSQGAATLRGRVRRVFGGGTQHPGAPAQPFFWPAVRLHNKKSKRAIKSAIRRAVKKEWGK